MVSCHAEGEVGNVIVDGVSPPVGDTLWDQSRWIDSDQGLRQFVLNEPRGGVFTHINLLVPAKNPEAKYGFIIMEPEFTPPMSGSNSICVATVLLNTGLIEMHEPVTEFNLEAPGGLVRIKAYCQQGKAQSIEIVNLPSFADKLDATLEVRESAPTASIPPMVETVSSSSMHQPWASKLNRTRRVTWLKLGPGSQSRPISNSGSGIRPTLTGIISRFVR